MNDVIIQIVDLKLRCLVNQIDFIRQHHEEAAPGGGGSLQ